MAPLFAVACVFVVMQGVQRRAEVLVTHTHEAKEALSDVLVGLLDAETSARGFVLTGRTTWLAPYEQAQRELPQQLSTLRALVSDNPVAAERLARVHALATTRLQVIERLIPYATPSHPPESLLIDGYVVMEKLRVELASMQSDEDRLLAERSARLEVVRRRSAALIEAASVLGLVGGLGAVLLFAAGVSRRVARVKVSAERLAHGEALEGEWSTAQDEVGQLDRALHHAAVLLDNRVQELQVAREELDRFFGLSLDMLCIAGVDGKFQRLNPAWQETLGWSTDDLTSTSYFSFIHEEDQATTQQQAARLAEGGAVVSFANRYRCKDGSYRWLSWKAAAHPDRRRIYAAARDVTDERRLEQELRQQAVELAAARLEAERANKAKTDFLAHMSHDLRTPLNAILRFAQLLDRETLTTEQRDSVRQIVSGGEHLLELISEVIDITRIESGQLSLSPEVVAVADVVQRAVELVKPLAALRGLTLIVEPMPPAGMLADRQRVHQILLNFLSNAVKYNRPSGRITVSFEHVPPGRCRIAVSDTGAGLSEDKLAQLFRPFERLGAEQTTVEGTGLGLALSRILAEAMGGAVGVRSKVDAGTTFWVELRATDVQSSIAPTVPEAVVAKGAEAQSGLVLYIEDNQANIRLMERILGHRTKVGFVAATDGETGIALVGERKPDLVFLDLHLPDMTGEEVLRRLWQDPLTREIPSVVLTADVTPGLTKRLKGAGARDHLTKPLNVTRVLEIVDRFLGERQGSEIDVGSAGV